MLSSFCVSSAYCLSEENNTPSLAYETLKEQNIDNCERIIAHQNEKTELIEV